MDATLPSANSSHSLNRRGSQATLISLLQLDPSPIDSPSPSTENGPQLGEKSQAITKEHSDERAVDGDGDSSSYAASSIRSHGTGYTSTLGLSSSGRGAIYYLTRIHRYASYATTTFTALHLANVSLFPLLTRSVPSSETYLLMTREIYQTSIAEPLLVALPVIAHVGAGITLRLLRRWQNMKRYGGGTPGMYALHQMRDAISITSGGKEKKQNSHVRLWPQLSYISISGYVFTLFYGAHVFMNRLLPLAVEGDSSNIGLAYVAHGFARHPAVAWTAYLGLISVACGHMVWGVAKWFGLAPSTSGCGWRGKESVVIEKNTKRQRRRKWLGVHGVSLAVAALWAVGGLGVVARGGLADGWVGKVYDDLFGTVGM